MWHHVGSNSTVSCWHFTRILDFRRSLYSSRKIQSVKPFIGPVSDLRCSAPLAWSRFGSKIGQAIWDPIYVDWIRLDIDFLDFRYHPFYQYFIHSNNIHSLTLCPPFAFQKLQQPFFNVWKNLQLAPDVAGWRPSQGFAGVFCKKSNMIRLGPGRFNHSMPVLYSQKQPMLVPYIQIFLAPRVVAAAFFTRQKPANILQQWRRKRERLTFRRRNTRRCAVCILIFLWHCSQDRVPPSCQESEHRVCCDHEIDWRSKENTLRSPNM